MSHFNENNKRAREPSLVENKLKQRRDKQNSTTKCFHWKEGDYWYLFPKMWSNLLIPRDSDADFFRTLSLNVVNNDELLRDGRLMPNLEMGKDFVAVPESIWHDFLKRYNLKITEIKRKIISREGRLTLELYPPVITVYFVDEMEKLDPDAKPLRLEVSEITLLQSVLVAIKTHFRIPSESEILLWISEDSELNQVASVNRRYLKDATMIDITDKNACVGQLGDATWIVELQTDDKFPFGMMVYQTHGKCGLVNLGNTCYMNSALQCLSNTPPLTTWFLNGNYKNEINRDNPLGMNGLIAEAYGELVEQLWTTQSSRLRPIDFKYTISKFNATFSGFYQQDTQELLASLLDGLHEDLNRIKKKPYFESPDFGGFSDEEIASYNWEYHLKRNNSIIVDLFQGQFKSKLICKACQNVSVTFDPFMYLSLPLPVKKHRSILLTYIPYDLSQRGIKVTLKLDRESNIFHLQKKLAGLVHTDPESLVVVEIYRRKIFRVFEQDDPISSISSRDRIYAYEIPCLVLYHSKINHDASLSLSRDESKIDEHDMNQPIVFPVYCLLSDNNEYVSKLLAYPVLLAISREDAYDIYKIYNLIYDHFGRFLPIGISKRSSFTHEPAPNNIDTEQQIQTSISDVKFVKTTEEEENQHINDIYTMKVFKSNRRSSSPKTPRSLPTNDRLNPYLMTTLTARLETMSEPHHVQISSNISSSMTIDQEEDQKMINIWNNIDDIDDDFSFRDGSSEEIPLPEPLIDQTEGIVLEWSVKKAQQMLGSPNLLYVYDTLYDPDIQDSDEKPIQLSDCLDEFTREEDLSEGERWYCPNCKQQQHITKKFDIWRLPKILIVHLKRFSHSRRFNGKIEDFIDFPVTQLDMTGRVLSIKYPDSVAPENRLVYDLYAVDNHYGAIGGGHYVTCAQNHQDGAWYEFDDSIVTSIDISSVKSEAAYLLFYKQRDTQQP